MSPAPSSAQVHPTPFRSQVAPSPRPAAATVPIKKVRFADEQPKPWCFTPAWWISTWNFISSRELWESWIEKAHDTVEEVLYNPWYFFFMATLTICSVFGDQVRLLTIASSVDEGFSVFDTFLFTAFMLDIVAHAWVYPTYLFQLFPYTSTTDLVSETHTASFASSSSSTARTSVQMQSHRLAAFCSSSAIKRSCMRVSFPSFYFWLDLLALILLPYDITFASSISRSKRRTSASLPTSRMSANLIRLIRVLRCCTYLRLVRYLLQMYDRFMAVHPFESQQILAHESSLFFSTSRRQFRKYSNGRVSRMGDYEAPNKRSRAGHDLIDSLGSNNSFDDESHGDNRLATTVKESVHRKIIVGGILLVTCLPFLIYTAEDTSWEFILGTLVSAAALSPKELSSSTSPLPNASFTTFPAAFAALLTNTTGKNTVFLQVDSETYYQDKTLLASLRYLEQLRFSFSPASPSHSMTPASGPPIVATMIEDIRRDSRQWAAESIFLSVATVLVFVSLSLSLHANLANLVFRPLEQIVQLVDRIRVNPLAPISGASADIHSQFQRQRQQQHGYQPQELYSLSQDKRPQSPRQRSNTSPAYMWDEERGPSRNEAGRTGGSFMIRSDQQSGLEPTLLLQTISKIGALVRIGLGDAGADIISRHLENNLDRGQESRYSDENRLDVMSPGKLVSAIFVFCDVRNFTDTTECLQEEVMIFVNKIATILHELTVQCEGAPNKNVGDAFLLVWKLMTHEEEEETDDEEEERPRPSPDSKTQEALTVDGGAQATLLAGQALYCVLNFALELSRLYAYVCQFSSAATQRLLSRMPDYKVGVGFGLHMGWAVEGAIGSDQKIDVSYISPHVTTSEYLQDLTKEYGCTVLVSDAFYHLLPSQAQYNCRQLDCVRQRGGHKEPMGIYTYDCDPDMLPAPSSKDRSDVPVLSSPSLSPVNLQSSHASKDPSSSPDQHRIGARNGSPKAITLRGDDKELPNIFLKPYTPEVWENDPNLQHIRTKLHPNFRATWNYAMSSYLAGEWSSAKQGFETTFELSGGRDGPSRALLKILEQYDNKAPSGWSGWREIG